jgi:hypothetical protein
MKDNELTINNLNTHHLVSGLALRTSVSHVSGSVLCTSLWWLNISDFYFSLLMFLCYNATKSTQFTKKQCSLSDTTTISATLRYPMLHTIQMFLMVSLGIFSDSFIVVTAPQMLCSVYISKLPVAAAASCCCCLDFYLLPLPLIFTFFFLLCCYK